MSGSTEGMTNLRKCKDSIVVGNGPSIKATMIGDKHGVITNRNGNKKKVEVLKEQSMNLRWHLTTYAPSLIAWKKDLI